MVRKAFFKDNHWAWDDGTTWHPLIAYGQNSDPCPAFELEWVNGEPRATGNQAEMSITKCLDTWHLLCTGCDQSLRLTHNVPTGVRGYDPETGTWTCADCRGEVAA